MCAPGFCIMAPGPAPPGMTLGPAEYAAPAPGWPGPIGNCCGLYMMGLWAWLSRAKKLQWLLVWEQKQRMRLVRLRCRSPRRVCVALAKHPGC